MRYSLFLCAALAACSSGGSGTIIDPIDELPTTIEPEANPAPTGEASYRGPTSLAFVPVLSEAVDLKGTMAIDVDFDAAATAVTGSASGFETASGGPVTGQLYLSGGALDDTDVALLFGSQISGSLQSGPDNYLVFGQVAGEFLESNQSAVSGRISGTVRQSGADSTLSGSFLAGRVP
jgi:hypothetical protein